jgi:anthranilate phosphoribosyltransferase
MELLVKLVLTPQATLTVNPLHEVDSGGPTTLTWVRDTTGADFQFSASSVSGLPNPPFSAPSYNPSNNTVTVTDTHTGQAATFSYALSVNAGGSIVNATGSPSIRNR